MKQYKWTVNVDAPSEALYLDLPGLSGSHSGEAEQAETPHTEGTASATETHTVSCTFSRLRGRITVSIDGDAFELPAGFLGLSAARREVFRLGGEQAILSVDRAGHATLTLHGQTVPPER